MAGKYTRTALSKLRQVKNKMFGKTLTDKKIQLNEVI